jgi:hypothetical protein
MLRTRLVNHRELTASEVIPELLLKENWRVVAVTPEKNVEMVVRCRKGSEL